MQLPFLIRVHVHVVVTKHIIEEVNAFIMQFSQQLGLLQK